MSDKYPRVMNGVLERKVMACGWCKMFVHRVAGRWVHDEKPRTRHEVLPIVVR